MSSTPSAFYVAAAVVGLIIGSLITQVAWRLPRMMEAGFLRADARNGGSPAPEWTLARYGLFTPAAACTSCGHPLELKEQVPLLSYLFLRGRCRACGAGIGLRYPLIEGTTAVIALLCVYRFGFTLAGLAAFLCCALLLTIALVDLESTLIPDTLTASVAILGVVANALWLPLGWEASLIGAASGLAGLWIAAAGYRLLARREGVGFGDVKLLGALGAWVGAAALPVLAIVAGIAFLVAAALSRTRTAVLQDPEPELPFGPSLALAGSLLILAPGLSAMLVRAVHWL
jgi:leader peptidase (prepilin peptidase) / N-methyltransferase